jgi:hypothetical protein
VKTLESWNRTSWKNGWTDADFQQMGWHDANISGLKFDRNLVLDIDYIFQWNQPEVEGFSFTFWVAPCSLVFDSPTELSFELRQLIDSERWLEIDDIRLADVDGRKQWTISTHQGDISFYSNGSNKLSVGNHRTNGQIINYRERGGISFDLTSGEGLSVKEKLNSLNESQ